MVSWRREPTTLAVGARKLPLLYVLASLALVVACLYWAKAVLIPVALAMVFTFLLNPVANMLQRRGLPRTPAVLLGVLLAFSWVGGIGWGAIRDNTLPGS